MARELAAAARQWRGLLVEDATGTVRDISPGYRPGRLLDEHIRARDRTCRFSRLPRPGRPRGCGPHPPTVSPGPGSAVQPGRILPTPPPLEGRNLLGWLFTQPEPGVFLFTSPSGRTYLTRPPPLVEVDLQRHPENDPAPC